jgi:hypothetical protein
MKECMDLKPGNFTSQSAREICRDPASESDRFRRQDASRGEWWGLAIAFSPDPELGNRPRRARPRFIGFCAEKRADLPGNYFGSVCVTGEFSRNDDENEDDFSTSEFSF